MGRKRKKRKRKQQHRRGLSGPVLWLLGLGSAVAEVKGREEGMQDLQGDGRLSTDMEIEWEGGRLPGKGSASTKFCVHPATDSLGKLGP